MYFIEQEGDEIIIYDDDDPATKRLKMYSITAKIPTQLTKNAKILHFLAICTCIFPKNVVSLQPKLINKASSQSSISSQQQY
jgi:hypothetical protein